MKKNGVCVTVLFIFLITQFQLGCGAQKPVVKLSDTPQFTFNQNYKYRIYSQKDPLSGKYSGSHLRFSYPEQSLFVQKASLDYQTIPLSQVEKFIEYTDQKQGKQWKKGLGIGLLSGAAVGGILLGGALADDGSGCEDVSECDGLAAIAGIAAFISTTVLGGVTGLLVGILTPKKKQIIYVP